MEPDFDRDESETRVVSVEVLILIPLMSLLKKAEAPSNLTVSSSSRATREAQVLFSTT